MVELVCASGQEIMTIFDSFYKSDEPWSKDNVYHLCKFICLQSIVKLHAHYILVKENPGIVLDPEEPPTEDYVDKNLEDYDSFSWKPIN